MAPPKFIRDAIAKSKKGAGGGQPRIIASRRGEWDQLLAATLVTVAFAVPTLVITAVWEVYLAPRLLGAIFGYA